MNLSIGTKIKQLRKQNDITQEKLADYLNISYQAISKWENGTALPDISMVIPIANFFGVTMDELFDMDTQRQEQEIKEIFAEITRLANKGLNKEREEFMRNAVKKYPNDYGLLLNYAYSLDEKESSDEVISICERILEDCTDHEIRSSAIQILVITYKNIGNQEKAVEYANKADGLYVCRDFLLSLAYIDPIEKTKHVQFTNLYLMDLLNEAIVYKISYENIDDEIFALETAIKILQLLIYDENYLFFNARLDSYNLQLAKLFAIKQNKTKVMEHLHLSKKHAIAYDTIPVGTHNYTSIFVVGGTHDNELTQTNSPKTSLESFADDLNNECFDFLRDDIDFINLIQ